MDIAVAVSLLLYGWYNYNEMHGKKSVENYSRMQGAVLNKPLKQHPTKQQLYGQKLSFHNPFK